MDDNAASKTPEPAPFVCPYHKPSPPWTWRNTVGMLLLVAAATVLTIGMYHVEKLSEHYWIMSAYLTKPITLYSYRGHREWVDRERIEKSDADDYGRAYRDGYQDGKGMCVAAYKRTKSPTALWVSPGCIDACANMRKAGAHDMGAQTPGHACEFFCEAGNERGYDDPWPVACLQKAKSYQAVSDCWLAREKR